MDIYRHVIKFIFIIPLMTWSSFATGLSYPAFLSDNLSQQDTMLILSKSTGSADLIKKLRVYYLSSNDCQSGYQAYYDTSSEFSFLIQKNHPFALLGNPIYLAGVSVIDVKRIEYIHSILIRIISHGNKLASFIDGCADQGINCCVPVVCSTATETCLAQYNMGTQRFLLD